MKTRKICREALRAHHSHTKPYRESEMPEKRKNILRAAFIVLAAALILLGITNGGLWDVLVKAINICTECIGLG